MSGLIKICGLKTADMIDAALDAGADLVGFVFHEKSPRFPGYDGAKALAQRAGTRARKVALLVEPDDLAVESWAECINADMLQLHGSVTSATALAETPQRVADIRAHHGYPVMKAIGIAEAADLRDVPAYAAVADMILLDAKPPPGAAYPGGHGQPFDWAILAALPKAQPFMLSGGLTPENVADAIRAIRAMGLNLAGVDVSSGVESAPGVKDAQKIRTFVANARRALDE